MLQHKLCARNELYDRDRRDEDLRPGAGTLCPLPASVLRRPASADRYCPGADPQPGFIVADEPISALDVSIQAQIINLFSDLRDNRGVTFLFISHDLGVVEHLCDDVAVMYLGQLVESASRDAVPAALHPYTRAPAGCGADLLDPHSELQALVRRGPGSATPRRLPPSRCPLASERVAAESLALREVALGRVACHWVAS